MLIGGTGKPPKCGSDGWHGSVILAGVAQGPLDLGSGWQCPAGCSCHTDPVLFEHTSSVHTLCISFASVGLLVTRVSKALLRHCAHCWYQVLFVFGPLVQKLPLE